VDSSLLEAEGLLARGDPRAESALATAVAELSLQGLGEAFHSLAARDCAVDPRLIAALSRRLAQVAAEEESEEAEEESEEELDLEHTVELDPPAAEEPQPAEPRGFHPFHVVRSLGKGGMGLVFEVEHRETHARYALKTVLPPEGGSSTEVRERARERFRREAELGARLDHPGIVRVHSARLEGRLPYLVQDLLPGGNLLDRLSVGQLPLEDALRVADEVADALEHAHGRGILHRDLKPENVVFDEHGRACLIDFGLALSLDTTQRLTQSGQLVGTPAYMAPEQVRGDESSPLTDAYALGGVLYAMLTGQSPVEAGLEEIDVVIVLRAILEEPTIPPSELRPDLPPGVERLVLALLAKDPSERLTLAGAREALARLRAGDEVEGLGRGRSPRRWWLAAVVVALLAAALFGGSPDGESPTGTAAWDERVDTAAILGSGSLAWDEEALRRDLATQGFAQDAAHQAARARLEAYLRLFLHREGRSPRVPAAAAGEARLVGLIDAVILLDTDRVAEAGQRVAANSHPLAGTVRLLAGDSPEALLTALEEREVAGALPTWRAVRALERLLAGRYAAAWLDPQAYESLVSLLWRADAMGVRLSGLEEVERVTSEEQAEALATTLREGQVSVEDVAKRVGSLLRAPPRTEARLRLATALRVALRACAAEKMRTGTTLQTTRWVLSGNGWLRLEVGEAAALRPEEMAQLVGRPSGRAPMMSDPYVLAGSAEFISRTRLLGAGRGLDRTELARLVARTPQRSFAIFLLSLREGMRPDGQARGTWSAATAQRLSAALEREPQGVPPKIAALCRVSLALRDSKLAFLAREKNPARARLLARSALRHLAAAREDAIDDTTTFNATRTRVRAKQILGQDPHGVLAWRHTLELLLARDRLGTQNRWHRALARSGAYLARALYAAGKREEARACLEETATRAPLGLGLELVVDVTRARFAWEEERFDDAWKLLQPHLRKAKTRVSLGLELERHYRRRGQAQAAETLMNELRARFPSSDALRSAR
jgi:hypothetical protein